MNKQQIIVTDRIETVILTLRGQKVILDADLARLYGVTTKQLNQAVKRNRDRFPSEFLFRLTNEEKEEVVTICDHLRKLKFSPQLPFAFTEHGVIMAATVLNSPQAVKASIYVVRAFVRLRSVLGAHQQLAAKIGELERKLEGHDEQIATLFEAIRALMEEPEEPAKPPIGFLTEASGAKGKMARRRSSRR